ncbi:PhzF family isomerase [Candidatus Gottesmanbacteria bacterium]|nr:PhzF family isomerase [Candidatus Gottesmanbacteria bacterium]
MKNYRLYQIDSFTKEKFRGNPAGVVTNADGLTEKQMQDIAREMNCSETAFIFSPKNKNYDVWVRYFTPTVEVPLCGHATIAAHYVRAIENKLPTSRVLSKTGAGILPVDIVKQGNDYKIIMTQGKIEFGKEFNNKNKKILLKALGLKENEIDIRCPIEVASAGHSKVMVGIKSKNKLNTLSPDLPSLAKLSKPISCNGYFVFTFDTNEPNILICGRMFAPAIGIAEDPVTGNANGPFGAYAIHHKLVKHNGKTYKFIAKQGEAIRRTGYVEVTVTIDKDEPVKTQVGGSAVIVFKTTISV